MTTRCPHCGTTFKVVPDQLRVRDGLVRCGECTTIFDGRACLEAQIPLVSQRSSALVETTKPEVPQVPTVLRNRSEIARYSLSLPVDEDLPLEPDKTDLLAVSRSREEISPTRQSEAFSIDSHSSEREAQQDPPIVVGESRPRHRSASGAAPEFLDTGRQEYRSFLRSLWGYACIFGLIVLAGQLTFLYRSSIAEKVPELRPVLERLCKPIGCEVDYARHIDQILITSSSLQPPIGQALLSDTDGPSVLVLRASLRNAYKQAQQWPALRLDLRDLSDTIVSRKELLPEAYLPKAMLQQPFGAGAELTIEVPIKVEGVSVNGFDLHKFFP